MKRTSGIGVGAAGLVVWLLASGAANAQLLDRSDTIETGIDDENPQASQPTFNSVVRNYLGLAECPLYGRKFWQLPNSDTCVRLIAQATADVFERSPQRPTDTIFRPQFVGGFDTRTPTSLGTFRAYATGRAVHEFLRSGSAGGATTDPTETDTEVQQNRSGLDRAFVEYVGLTIGRTYSFFDFENGYNFAGARVSLRRSTLAAYTAYFGDAWSVTGSVEDHYDRKALIAGDPTAPVASGGVPNFVGAIRHLSPRTRVQLSAASHVVETTNPLYPETLGYAAQLGGEIYFPDISTPFANRLTLTAAYAEGAVSYLGFTTSAPDAVAFANRLFLTRGWNVAGSYLHFWSEQWSSAFTLGYASLSTGLSSPNFSSLDEWKATANIVWRPSSEWQIGAEYQHSEQRTVFLASTRTRNDRGQIRIRYDF